jgi:poly-beta-1,6-N-acetyl-D-glucosamine synthase
MASRLLVISPVRNEAAHFNLVASAMMAQTRPPDLWVVVDDGSTDGTTELLTKLSDRVSFMSVVKVPPPTASQQVLKDRLAVAAEARAFNTGLESVPWRTFTHIAKLDGDISLPPRYFELLMNEFEEDPALGLAGGVLRERRGDGWAHQHAGSAYHVRGALKCYTQRCLVAIGGVQERLAWDTIDEVYARMHGYKTRTLPQLVGLHHRPGASADGILRGRARHGRGYYIAHYPFAWVFLRSFRASCERPFGLSGLAFLGGYLAALGTGAPRVEDAEFRTYVHRELASRARHALRARAPIAQRASTSPG